MNTDDFKLAREIIEAPGNLPPPENVDISDSVELELAEMASSKLSHGGGGGGSNGGLAVAQCKKPTQPAEPRQHTYIEIVGFDTGTDGVTGKAGKTPKCPFRFRKTTAHFKFSPPIPALAGREYLLAFWENGRSHVHTTFFLDNDAALRKILVTTARPGCRSARCWITVSHQWGLTEVVYRSGAILLKG